MKKFSLFLILILTACLKQIPEKERIPSNLQKIIEKLPPERISAFDRLIFDFAIDFPESEIRQEINASKIFQFMPSLEGKAWWESKDKIAYMPFMGFRPGESYKCKLNLSLLSQKFSDFPPLEFSFSVYENEVLYFNNYFENEYFPKNIIKQILKATFLMTKKDLKVEFLKDAIKVSLNGNPLEYDLKKNRDTYELKASFLPPANGGEIKIEFDKDKLKLSKPISYSIPIAPLVKFRAEKIKVQWEGGEPKVILTFSHSLKEDENFDTYIRIEPVITLNYTPQGNILKISGDLKHGTEYKITILPGIRSFYEEKLKEEQNFTFRLKDLPPEIKIPQNKIYLSSKSNKNLRFKSVNIKKVDLSVYFIPVNNLIFFLQEFSQESKYYDDYELNKVGKKIFSEDINIPAEKNKWIEQDINLNIPENLPQQGIFFVILNFNKENTLWECQGVNYDDYYEGYYNDPCSYGYYYERGRISAVVAVSDIALLALMEKNKWNLWAYNIINGEPEGGVEIEGFEFQNLLAEKQTTNRNGFASFSKEGISFFIAKKGKNLSFIKIGSSSPPLEPFDLGGFYPSASKGIRAFTYTERGVYRPSDEIHLTAILRDGSQKPAELPLKCIFVNPLKQKISEEISSSSLNGVYYFKLKTDYDAPTGIWNANLYIGDEFLTSHSIRVEMIVPPKIKPEIKVEKEKVSQEDFPLPIEISSNYLFGAPSSGLPYKLKLKLTDTILSFPKYKDFKFSSLLRKFQKEENLSEGILNDQGRAQVQWNFKKEIGYPSLLSADLILEVTEKGGRPAYDKKTLTLFPYSYYLGAKFDTDKTYQAGESVKIEYIVLDKNGNPAPDRELEVRIYFNYYHWWWEVRDIKEIISSHNTQVKNFFTLKSKSNPSSFDVMLNESYGSYFVEIKDVKENNSLYLNIPLAYWGEKQKEAGGSFMQFEGAKESYKIGENINLNLKTPSEGTLFYAIVKGDRIIKWDQEKLKSTKTSLKLNVTEEMLPSAYLFISAIQKMESKNDLPLRSYTIIPFNVIPEKGKLEMEVSCPDKIKPEQKFPVKIKILNNSQAVVTLAVVDSGLINLTGEKTPDPYNFFYQKVSWNLSFRDSFDFFYPIEDLPAEFTYKVGGEGAGQKLLTSPVKSNPFPPVVFFRGPQLVKGEEQIEVQLPNYLGEVKVIVVGTWDGSFGNYSKSVKVIDDLIPYATFPRAVAPQDEFEISLQLFIQENKKEKIKIEVNSSKHFEISKENKIEIPFEKGEKMVYFYAKAKDNIGEGEIRINFKNPRKSPVIQTIPIHPVNNYISKNEFYLLREGEEKEIKVPILGFPETNKATLLISTYKNVPLKSMYESVTRYPFGCIEQTSSKLFATLFLRDMVLLYGEIFPGLSSSYLDSILEEGFRKLQGFALPDANFSFWPSSSYPASDWTSIYVTHLLVEASIRGFALKSFLEKTINYQKIMARRKIENPKNQAYRLYVLSLYGSPDFPSMNLLKENYIKNMDIHSKIILAAAYAQAKDYGAAKEIYSAIEGIENISLRGEYLYSSWGTYGNYLYFISQIQKEYAEKYFEKISGFLKEKEWWSTHDIGWFCAGFSSLLGKTKEVRGKIEAFIKYPDGKEEKIEKESKFYSLDLTGYLEKNIKIKNNEKNILFLDVVYSGIPKETPQKPEFRNMVIKTTFLNENGQKIDEKNLKSGDIVYEEIELELLNQEKYIALSQILPGGWEPINLRLLNLELPSWASGGAKASYMDIRDDRINIFLDDPYYQRHFVFYIPVKVVTKGKFLLPPTTGQAMYNPEFYAILPQGLINIE